MLSIDVVRIIIHQEIGWTPNVWHKRQLLLGGLTLKDAGVINDDVLEIGIANKTESN